MVLRFARSRSDSERPAFVANEACVTSDMAIASINPATGETLKNIRAARRSDQIEEKLHAQRTRAFEHHRSDPFAKRAQLHDGRGVIARAGEGPTRAHHHARDGKASARCASRKSRNARAAVASMRRMPSVFWPMQPAQTSAARSYVRYEPIGRGARDHAVEFSFLAGLPFRRAGADGGQRRPAQTRRQRSAMRARD